MGMPPSTLDYAQVLRQGPRRMLSGVQSIPEVVLGSDSCCFLFFHTDEEFETEFLICVIPGLGRHGEDHCWSWL